MQRSFTVTLTESEAATVWRMSEVSGVPAAQIVRHLHRTTLFSVLEAIQTDPLFRFTDDHTGWTAWREDLQDRHFRSWTRTLLDLPGGEWNGL
ncbi:MAG: hypothetical protein INR70_20180 [Parafilimonas terrae]|nr:hypothetical protein [Parafilimonas terrae]